MPARVNLKLARLELQDYGARSPSLLARRRPYLFGEAANHRLNLPERHIGLERVFSGDRLRRAVGNHRMLIDAARQLVQARAESPERRLQRGQFQLTQLAHRAHAQLLKPLLRNFTNSGNASHRQCS